MMAGLTNHLWQSTFFALVAGVLTLAFRANRAHVRYWLWFSASLKFFVPFALLMSLGSRLEWAPAAQKIATPAVSSAIEQMSEPFSETVTFTPHAPGRTDWVPVALFAIWACGFLAIAVIRFRSWRGIRAAVRASVPIEIPVGMEVRSSTGLLEPGVVGIWRSILLLPGGLLEQLTPSQLEAVLAHELCHVRRRDNLTASIHMIVEAVFWFHPLVWWIGARLVEEREQACDEEVLSLGNEPQVYAEAILNVCKLYVESPLTCVAGVTGSDLKRRIEAIMINRIGLRLNFAKKVALGAAAVAALATPVVVGTMHARPLPVILRPVVAAVPMLNTAVEAPPAPQKATPKTVAKSEPPPVAPPVQPMPVFEVASIKPCAPGEQGGGGGRSGAIGRSGGSGSDPQGPSPDRLNLVCQPAKSLLRMAYVMFANGRRTLPGLLIPIEGGPSWLDTERYRIEAKAEGAPGQEMMRGPMLQALLEERFKLKVRHETREVPAYALVVAKNGPKMQVSPEGSCIPFDSSKLPRPGSDITMPTFCGMREFNKPMGEGSDAWRLFGSSMDEFSKVLGGDMDRIVVNKTGLAGVFDFRMRFAPDDTTPGLLFRGRGGAPATQVDTASGPSIFTAIQEQLGLKLESSKGMREFIVIDRIEKPTEN